MASNSNMSDEEGPVELPVGKIVSKRWIVLKKIGEGGCGSVYMVKDLRDRKKYALKAESNFTAGGAVLKLEVEILRRLHGRPHIGQLLHAGKRLHYSYMVMTLFGPSLSKLLQKCGRECSISTQVRVGIQMLFCIKQLHDCGFVHRDIKPANFAIGASGASARMLFMLDFGLAREFVRRDEQGRVFMRRPRSETLFRGTTRYCSLSVHRNNDQCRADDLWSLMYVLIELRGILPWQSARTKQDIARVKAITKDSQLCSNCPVGFLEILAHLRSLDYFTRPNYLFIYRHFVQTMHNGHFKMSDAYDWEPFLSRTLGRVMPHANHSTDSSDLSSVPSHAHESGKTPESPFTDADFASNGLGF